MKKVFSLFTLAAVALASCTCNTPTSTTTPLSKDSVTAVAKAAWV